MDFFHHTQPCFGEVEGYSVFMSRRSRRRSGRGKPSWGGRIVIGLLVAGVVGVFALIVGIRGYLHSDSFRKMLSMEAGKALDGDGAFEAFRWKGLQVKTDSFKASGKGPVRQVRAEGIETEIGLGGFSRGVWEVRGFHIRKLEAKIDLTKVGVESVKTPDKGGRAKPARRGWLPNQAEVVDAEIGNIAMEVMTPRGPASIMGTRLRAELKGGPMSYQAKLDGGVLQLPFEKLSPVKLDKAEVRWQDSTLFLTALDAEMWEKTRLSATGEWDSISQRSAFEGAVTEIPCVKLLNDTWSRRVTGEFDLSFEFEQTAESKNARGKIELKGGTLTALPVLDVLAAYADTRRFRVIQLTEARSDWRWRDGVLHFTNLVLASEGLIRLEGGLALRGRELDGMFRLGLPPGTLSQIPGAETHVFLPGERGFLWTTIRVTGTLDKPREDLSDRLIAAAGERMFEMLPETGEMVIRYSKTLAADAAPKVIEEGVRVIEQGTEIIQGANSLLDGLLGVPRALPPPRLGLPEMPEK